MLSMVHKVVQKSSVPIDRYYYSYALRHVTLDSSVSKAEDCSRKTWTDILRSPVRIRFERFFT